MFKSTAKNMSGTSVVWEENDKRIEEGNSKFFGERIVGRYTEAMVPAKKGAKTFYPYRIHLYADFNDESKFGKTPDGEEVTVWGGKVLNGHFERGTDGNGIQPGDIVEIIYKGMRTTTDGENNTYPDFDVNAFTPSPEFKSSAPKAAAGVTQAPVAKTAAAKKAMDDLGY